ncbi:hypothetical protein CC86DRAFT_140294 [Ophiobolus disseminans]|uniref:Uncharacterized protein n=1 Tax=Ophiobolus disseminans TaxID=1469910 RepID=A0A6A7ADY0_9PLEO|nr:hypothetical protein CC86DRAFT_140294 [Ophiobolus disseminans]
MRCAAPAPRRSLPSILMQYAQYPILTTTHNSEISTVGIALTVDHATASVRYQNGTFEDLGRVEANAEYKELMRRLSSPDACHPHPPYESSEEEWHDYPRQLRRRLRMLVGLPASSDVAILAELLENIAQITFPEPGSQRAAVISYPALWALYQEDLYDAAAHRGIATLRSSPWGNYQSVELVSAYAGHGLGLCKDPVSSFDRCFEEEEHLPERLVVLFEYTEYALVMHRRYLSRVHLDPFMDTFIDPSFDLGSANHPSGADIQKFVLQFLLHKIGCYEGYYPFTCPEVVTFILTGSESSYRGENARMVIEAIAVAVHEFGSTGELFFSNPDFMAARGAAEMAWRASVVENRPPTPTQ